MVRAISWSYEFKLSGSPSTTKDGWKKRGIGIEFGTNRDMRMIMINLFFLRVVVGWR